MRCLSFVLNSITLFSTVYIVTLHTQKLSNWPKSTSLLTHKYTHLLPFLYYKLIHALWKGWEMMNLLLPMCGPMSWLRSDSWNKLKYNSRFSHTCYCPCIDICRPNHAQDYVVVALVLILPASWNVSLRRVLPCIVVCWGMMHENGLIRAWDWGPSEVVPYTHLTIQSRRYVRCP